MPVAEVQIPYTINSLTASGVNVIVAFTMSYPALSITRPLTRTYVAADLTLNVVSDTMTSLEEIDAMLDQFEILARLDFEIYAKFIRRQQSVIDYTELPTNTGTVTGLSTTGVAGRIYTVKVDD